MAGLRDSLLAAAAVGIAGGGLLWAGLRPAPSMAAGPGLEAGTAEAASRQVSPMVLREPAAPSATPQASGAWFLDDYYGPDASEVRALLAAEGVDLEGLPLPMPEADLLAALPTWLRFEDHERTSMRREKLQWPAELTNDWLQVRYGILVELGPEELETIDFLAELSRPDIEAAADIYFDELELAMLTEYAQGGVRTSPFLEWPRTPPGQGNPVDPAFYSLVRVGQGWIARVGVSPGRYPAAAAARLQIHQQVRARDERVHDALVALQ